MVWSKVPSAATAIACAACIAAAAAVPGAEMEAAHIATTVAGDVQLSAIDLSQLAGLNAIPLYQALLSGDLATALDPTNGLSSLNAIPGYLALLNGDPSGLANIAAFSAIPSFLSGDFTSQDAFNAIPIYQQLATGNTTNLYQLSSVNALVPFSKVSSEGLQAFVPGNATGGDGTTNPGYAALSGLYYYQQAITTGDITNLSGIDAFSALPNWKNFLSSGDISSTGLGGIDAFSALAAITPTPTPLAAKQETATTDTQTPLAKTLVNPAPETGTPETPKVPTLVKALSAVTPPSSPDSGTPPVTEQQSVTPDASSLPTVNDKSAPTGKPSNGSYSGVFKPNNNSTILFGSGGGSSADNGIRGWDKVVNGIKGAVGGSSSSSSGG
jgi:hypothetical protein